MITLILFFLITSLLTYIHMFKSVLLPQCPLEAEHGEAHLTNNPLGLLAQIPGRVASQK
jgi:hypothetical protein